MEELISKDIKSKNVVLILVAALLIPIVAFTPFAIASIENKVNVSELGVNVNLVGGVYVPWVEIESVEMVSELPKAKAVDKRFGDAMKGDYKATADGAGLKFIINGEAPYIKIVTDDFTVYLNQYYSKDTRKVFQEIMEGLNARKKKGRLG